MFPILGTLEQVKNYDKNDEFSDAQKVNEYASWYLSGVNNRAEYEEIQIVELLISQAQFKNYYPVIQDAQRISTIASASATSTYTDDDTQQEVDNEPLNHNQIVVCGDALSFLV